MQLEIQSRDVLEYKVPQDDQAYQESMEIEVDQVVWAQMAIKGLGEWEEILEQMENVEWLVIKGLMEFQVRW